MMRLLFIFMSLMAVPSVLGVLDTLCKAHPRHQGWPSLGDWRQLNKTLGGRLIKPTPPGAVCHPGQPTYNPKLCAEAQKAWETTEYHCKSPVSVLLDQFTNYTCLPDPSSPCTPDGYPAYVINATAAEHVKLGIDFARRHKVRLVVKATGHDYLGRSIAPGALSIWTRNLKNITHHSGEFKLSASRKIIRGNAMTFGAGIQMQEAYAAAGRYNQTIVGGQGSTVGIVGYVTGGGHSALGPRYGMAADNVLEMIVVTAGGKIVAINEDRYPDLFWAMRGGGGSTFGVIIAITLKTHPTPQITSARWAAFTDRSDNVVKYGLLSYLSSQIPHLMDAGISGYVFLSSNMSLPLPLAGLPSEVAGVFGTAVLQDALHPEADLMKLFKPLNDTIQGLWPKKVTFVTMIKHYKSFFEWYQESHDAGRGGGSTYVVSRLLEEDVLKRDQEEFLTALQSTFKANSRLNVFMVGGKGVREA